MVTSSSTSSPTSRCRGSYRGLYLLLLLRMGIAAVMGTPYAVAFAAAPTIAVDSNPHAIDAGGAGGRYRLHRFGPLSPMNRRCRRRFRRAETTFPSPSSYRNHGTTNGNNSNQNSMALSVSRGGAASAAAAAAAASSATGTASPQALFHTLLAALAVTTAMAKVGQRMSSSRSRSRSNNPVDTTATSSASASAAASVADNPSRGKSDSVKSLQVRFLSVFWLLRCSDWLQGPYFYEVYASKVFHGVPASMALVSRLFLTGFASTALFGPIMGRAADQYGRKKATIAFAIVYALGAWSTRSPLLLVLLLGRVLSGMGTSLLFSAPESWLVGAAQATNNQAALGETFGLAYAGDSLVAIAAGQMAGWAAAQRGPTGPFELSTGFLAAGGVLAAWLWNENKAQSGNGDITNGEKGRNEKPSIGEAMKVIRRDPNIISVGAVQSLFESAMYIFVLQWPPAVAKAVTQYFGPNSVTPYGTVFSCFMASCLLGSTMFGQLSKQKVSTEASTTAMLSVATVAMGAATWAVKAASGSDAVNTLPQLIAALFCFEACVGMYFPSIGTLRSRYVPDSHRSVIMNLFGIPLNVLVVAVFLSIHKLGITGALAISSTALGFATLAMGRLWRQTRKRDGTT